MVEILQKLRDGASKGEVAQWLQEQKGECKKLTRTTLERYIETLRAQAMAPAPQQAKSEPYILPKEDLQPIFELDEVQEIAAIYYTQKKRIVMLTAMESVKVVPRGGGEAVIRPMATLSREVEVATRILQASVEIKDAKGVLRPMGDGATPTAEILIKVQSKYGHQVAKTIEDPQSRQRLISIMKKTAELAQAKSEQPDGH